MPLQFDKGMSPKEIRSKLSELRLAGRLGSDINPVFEDWKEEVIENLENLKIEIGNTLLAETGGEKKKERGQLVLKHIPSNQELFPLHYAEIKEIYSYAFRTWRYGTKGDYERLKEKCKKIKSQDPEILLDG